jgi:Na+-driven multidrug efflux pump
MLFIDVACEAGQIAVEGLPLFASGFMFFIMNICIVGYYQSIEKIGPSVTVMLLRGVVLLLPCFYILPELFGSAGIWLAAPVAELATVFLFVSGLLCFRQGSKRLFSKKKGVLYNKKR